MSEHSDFDGVSYTKINQDIIEGLTHTTWRYWLALGASGVFVLIGAATYYYQSTEGLGVWGTNEPIFWGLDIPSFIFWIGFSLSGTLLSAILLLTKSHWRNPIYRAAEIMTGLALLTAQVIVLTHMGRPWRFFYAMPYPNMRFLWSNFRSPLTADILGMIAYLTASVLFLFVGAIPDFAVLRDNTTGWRRKFYTVASLGWKGSDSQWRHFRRAYLMIACFIIPIAVSMHSVTSWVPSMTINPGSRSTIYPMYFVTGALLSGAAGVVLILIILRRFLPHAKEYLKIKYLDHLAKLVLVASMLISYIYLVEIFVPAYKETNFEFMPLTAKLFGKYAVFFWPMVVFNSLLPLAFFKRSIRQNTVALFLISAGVQVGMYIERVLMIIPSLSIGPLPSTWIAYQPTWVEFVLLVWGVSIFTFLYLAVIKVVPVISIFEVKELLKLPKRSEIPAAVQLSEQEAVKVLMAQKGTARTDETLAGLASTTILMSNNGHMPVLGLFLYVDDAVKAINELKDAGFENIEVQSPVPCHEIDMALDKDFKGRTISPRAIMALLRNRNLRVIRFSAIGALATAGLAAALAGGTAILYPVPGGGLPIIALPSLGFTVGLLATLGGLVISVAAMFFLARLPSFRFKAYDTSVTDNRFAVIVHDCDSHRVDIGVQILQGCGAIRVVEKVTERV